ncbi:hypothetical protein D3C78_1573460 [compost metagenome]
MIAGHMEGDLNQSIFKEVISGWFDGVYVEESDARFGGCSDGIGVPHGITHYRFYIRHLFQNGRGRIIPSQAFKTIFPSKSGGYPADGCDGERPPDEHFLLL